MSGIPRQPAEIAKAKGVYRPVRHGQTDNKVHLEYLSAVPKPPDNLNEHGAKFWMDMLNQLLKVRGLVMIADLPTFQMMAYKFQSWMEYSEMVEKEGKFIRYKNGELKEHPANIAMEKAEKIFISLAREFGCTPSARNNLKQPNLDEKKESLEDFKI